MGSSGGWVGRSKGREIRSLLHKIRSFIPEISLRSSLIVGFPGEEESQFNSLLEFVEETRFDHLGVFKYSTEEETPASRLRNQVPDEVKEERMGLIMERQREISLRKNRAMVGKTLEVLVDGEDRKKGTLKAGSRPRLLRSMAVSFLRGQPSRAIG